MAYDEDLASRVEEILASNKNVAPKKMFGGLCFLHNGNMLVGVWKDSLIARIGKEAQADALLEDHVRRFDVTGKPMAGWVMVDAEGLDEDSALRDWIRRSLEFVATLPAK